MAERATEVLNFKREKGEWAGRVPFGFLIGEDGKLQENPEQIKTIQRAKRMKRQGMSVRVIAERLRISKSVVQRLVNVNLRTIKTRYTAR